MIFIFFVGIGKDRDEATQLLAKVDNNESLTNIRDIVLLFEYYTYEKQQDDCSITNPQEINLKKAFGTFFKKNNKENVIEQYIAKEDFQIDESFWNLVDNYKLYSAFDSTDINALLSSRSINCYFFEHKKIVEMFSKEARKELVNPDTDKLFNYSKKILEQDENFYVPQSFTQEDFDIMMNRILDIDFFDMNFIFQILKHPPKIMERFTVSNELMDRVTQIFNVSLSNPDDFKGGILKVTENQIQISFDSNQEEFIKIDTHGNYIMSSKWIDECSKSNSKNKLMNVYSYITKCTNLLDGGVMRMINRGNNHAHPLMEVAYNKNINGNYNSSYDAQTIDLHTSFILLALYVELAKKGIFIEEIIVYFFETYLKEYDVSNFQVSLSQPTENFLNKCKITAPEIESILKQWNDYVSNSNIDQSRSSYNNMINFDTVKSLIKDKYFLFSPTEELKKNCDRLFNDNSSFTLPLSHYKQVGIHAVTKYPNFYLTVLFGDRLNISEYDDTLSKEIRENPFLQILENGDLAIKKGKESEVALLYVLYNTEIVTESFLNSTSYDAKVVNEFKNNNTLKSIEGRGFFAEKESQYLNQLLKSNYPDGKELRNKYTHGNYHSENHQINYISFLKVILIIMEKIEDELHSSSKF
ncbi:hypothetical protein [Enterococcus sp.]|uniref:hypothetical protein n=1 Tax=Enterococcus sp. TaxID=35783 RepID=UPI0029136D55|nr:hypothetical protein [Enterococcus sp.]MDU5337160.1 hypothetical protein [Enterococcus sp.]